MEATYCSDGKGERSDEGDGKVKWAVKGVSFKVEWQIAKTLELALLRESKEEARSMATTLQVQQLHAHTQT